MAAAGALLWVRQSGSVAERHDLHCAADGLLLQYAVSGVAAGQPAGGAHCRIQLCGCVHYRAGRVCVASAGAAAGLAHLWADPGGVMAGLWPDPLAVSRGFVRQSLSADLAGGQLSGLWPVRGGKAMAQAKVSLCRGGVGTDAAAGHLGQYPAVPRRRYERNGDGCGAGGKRGAVRQRRSHAGGLRQQQQFYRRRCPRIQRTGGDGLPPSQGGGRYPFSRGSYQRPVYAADPAAGGYAVPAGYRR